MNRWMLKLIRKIKFSFMILYSIIFSLVGTLLISNAIIRTEFFGGMHYPNYQDKELKEFVFSYQSVFTNFNDDISLPNKSEKNMLQSLPKDLYLIKDVKVKKDRFIHLGPYFDAKPLS